MSPALDAETSDDIMLNGFEDFAWATKFELKKYLSKEVFEEFKFLDVK